MKNDAPPARRIIATIERLPETPRIVPVTSPSPSALAPLMVAISITSTKPSGGIASVSVSFQGTHMFQVKRMFSNMLGGAIEVASEESVTDTPAARVFIRAVRGSPCSPRRSSEWVEKLSGVPVRAIAERSLSVAAT